MTDAQKVQALARAVQSDASVVVDHAADMHRAAIALSDSSLQTCELLRTKCAQMRQWLDCIDGNLSELKSALTEKL